MNKKLVLIIIGLFCWEVTTPIFVNAQNLTPTKPQQIYNNTNIQTLKNEIEFLSDTLCGGRGSGTVKMNLVSFWLANKFKDIGLVAFNNNYFHSFYINNNVKGRNIIGFIPSKLSNTYTVIMAHYDGIEPADNKFYPGADSNGSGVVALLSIAKTFAERQDIRGNIIFVLTDAKNFNMAGAESFYNDIKNQTLVDPYTERPVTIKDISLIVNLDQLGSILSPVDKRRKDYLIMLGSHSLTSNYQGALNLCNKDANLNLDLHYNYYGSVSFTKTFYELIMEQKYFVKEGVPAVVFTSGITLNNNKPQDNVQSLNYTMLQKRIVLIYNWLDLLIPTNQNTNNTKNKHTSHKKRR